MIVNRNDVSGFEIRSELFVEDEIKRRSNTDVFMRTDAIPINFKARLTPAFVSLADDIFDAEIKSQPAFRKNETAKKREFFRRLLHASFIAAARGVNVRYSRNINSVAGCKSHLQIIECARTANYLDDFRATKTANNKYQSRLVITDKLNQIRPKDPWEYAPSKRRNFVLLRDRETKNDLAFDANEVSEHRQRILELHNEVNSTWRVFYNPILDAENKIHSPVKEQLRPIGYSVFNDDFDNGGRIYYGKFGHQNLRREERATICFEQIPGHLERSIELDYGCYHGLISYHLAGRDYLNDLYLIHGKATSKATRSIAKLVFNTLINAKDKTATLRSCRAALEAYEWTTSGKKRQRYGKRLREAVELKEAYRQCGLSFQEIYNLLAEKHKAISGVFSSEIGREYQRLDSGIAIDIYEHFAAQKVVCLGVHDSFLVPARYESELRQAMNYYYKKRLGFWPKIKSA